MHPSACLLSANQISLVIGAVSFLPGASAVLTSHSYCTWAQLDHHRRRRYQSREHIYPNPQLVSRSPLDQNRLQSHTTVLRLLCGRGASRATLACPSSLQKVEKKMHTVLVGLLLGGDSKLEILGAM